jgi:leucyl aminopeptidase
MSEGVSAPAASAIPIDALLEDAWSEFAAALAPPERAAATLAAFTAKAGEVALIPDDRGALRRVLFGLGDQAKAMGFRGLAGRLPSGQFELPSVPAGSDASEIVQAFALGAYRFDRYRPGRDPAPRLLTPPGGELGESLAHAHSLARDMINSGANDMGPLQVETIAREIAHAQGADITVTTGEALLEAGYPAVHAVGRAAAPARAPRMIEISWGEAGAPHVVIIGKGVVFDSGGLDIKPSSGMRLMKKDMGGAAHALALGRMIMAARLGVRLTVLTPVVENAIGGDAMRPGDVIASRKGLFIEVGNTDAEGRLILADALTRAGELAPDLTIDLATLTGAARVALGPEVTPFYTADEDLAADIAAASAKVEDPLWRMPLWDGYAAALDSDVADITNEPEAWAQAGSVTAALFLRRFAPDGPWAHFDIFAWNPRGRPGWAKGAEIQAIRALFAMMAQRWP